MVTVLEMAVVLARGETTSTAALKKVKEEKSLLKTKSGSLKRFGALQGKTQEEGRLFVS